MEFPQQLNLEPGNIMKSIFLTLLFSLLVACDQSSPKGTVLQGVYVQPFSNVTYTFKSDGMMFKTNENGVQGEAKPFKIIEGNAKFEDGVQNFVLMPDGSLNGGMGVGILAKKK